MAVGQQGAYKTLACFCAQRTVTQILLLLFKLCEPVETDVTTGVATHD